MHVDLAFALTGTEPIPADHGFPLYGALSRLLPELHEPNGVAVHPIRGRQVGNRLLALMPWSRMTLRTEADRIPILLKLAGRPLDLAGRKLRIGVPEVRPLHPAPALRSRLVTVKLKQGVEPQQFLEAVRRKLDALGVSPEAAPTLGKRRTLRIRDKEVIGYELMIEALTAEDSLILQEHRTHGDPHKGFSRRHMGCAVFVPFTSSGGPE